MDPTGLIIGVDDVAELLVIYGVTSAITSGSSLYYGLQVAREADALQMKLAEATKRLHDEILKQCPDRKLIEALQNYIDFLEKTIRYYTKQSAELLAGVTAPLSNLPVMPSAPDYIDLPVEPWRQ